MELADTYRKLQKYDEAKKEYTALQDMKGLSVDVRARMYLGLGYISLENAISAKKETARKDAYHEAYKNFLRVYLNAKGANAEFVAEGLYNAAKAELLPSRTPEQERWRAYSVEPDWYKS